MPRLTIYVPENSARLLRERARQKRAVGGHSNSELVQRLRQFALSDQEVPQPVMDIPIVGSQRPRGFE